MEWSKKERMDNHITQSTHQDQGVKEYILQRQNAPPLLQHLVLLLSLATLALRIVNILNNTVVVLSFIITGAIYVLLQFSVMSGLSFSPPSIKSIFHSPAATPYTPSDHLNIETKFMIYIINTSTESLLLIDNYGIQISATYRNGRSSRKVPFLINYQ